MSRPHDAQRSSFPFGNPFRRILPRASYLSPNLLTLLHSFEQTLAESLRKLKPENTSDVLSLSWMRQAMKSLSDTHINVKVLTTALHFPVSDWDEVWLDMYLDNSVKLLDICIALMSEISRLDHCQILLKYVIHILACSSTSPSSEQLKRAHSSLHDWMQQISARSPKLDCFAILEELAGTLHLVKVKNSAKGKVLMRALYGVKVQTIFVSSVFTAALSGCSKPLLDLQISGDFLWANAFNDLQVAVNGEVRNLFLHGKSVVFKELEAVNACAEKLHTLIIIVNKEENKESEDMTNGKESALGNPTWQEEDQWKEPASNLAKTADSFALELDLLSKQVDEFFQLVLSSRDVLLSSLRISDANFKASCAPLLPSKLALWCS
ncbi:UPF0496 protein 4-like [Iris pallida]|uniref:UPF0496 protein 4-like n=1 Tax=Iris pallida TaxID=29817 RepID=A0AAX6GDF1_IRIPA|nr:UPF0496 protein 4-like [Iris pallida]